MTAYTPIGRPWRTLTLDPHGTDRALEGRILRRLARVLGQWDGTPYAVGQCRQGAGVYCTAFVAAVLDELYGCEPTPLPEIPNDISFHNPEGARSGLRWFLRHYPKAQQSHGAFLEPGDVLITGPVGGGPGHAMIVGPQENTIWEASGTGVRRVGMALPSEYQLHAVYRFIDRHVWGEVA